MLTDVRKTRCTVPEKAIFEPYRQGGQFWVYTTAGVVQSREYTTLLPVYTFERIPTSSRALDLQSFFN